MSAELPGEVAALADAETVAVSVVDLPSAEHLYNEAGREVGGPGAGLASRPAEVDLWAATRNGTFLHKLEVGMRVKKTMRREKTPFRIDNQLLLN